MNAYVVNRYNVPTKGATSQLLTFASDGSSGVLQFAAHEENTKVIFMTVTGAGVYMTVDGSVPAPNNNHKLYAGNNYYFNSDLVSKAKFKNDNTATSTGYIYASELTN